MIPRIAHIVALNAFPVPLDAWAEHNPDIEVRIYDESAIDSFESRDKIRSVWGDWPKCADIIRLEKVAREGGIACDADMPPVAPLPDWLLECEAFAASEEEVVMPGLLANGFYGSIPANPFFESMLAYLLASDISGLAWQVTGPMLLSHWHKLKRYRNLTILPSHVSCPEHYAGVRYTGGGPVWFDHRHQGSPHQ